MNVLALDTSTLVASVAVRAGGRTLQRDARVTTHSEKLLALVDQVLGEAGLRANQLDAVACGAGPGSFTGLRIGMATAKGLCFALSRPLVTASSLAALAMEGGRGVVLAILDAKKHEVYAGLYRLTGPDPAPAPLAPDTVLPPARLGAWVRGAAGDAAVLVVGDGVLAYPAECARIGQVLEGARGTPSASRILTLVEPRLRSGATDELVVAVPRYLRPSEAELKFPDGIRVDPSKGPS